MQQKQNILLKKHPVIKNNKNHNKRIVFLMIYDFSLFYNHELAMKIQIEHSVEVLPENL